MDVEFTLHRFEEFGRLNAAEKETIMALGDAPKEYARLRTIRSEGAAASGFYILLEGWVTSCVTLPDGGRQIMKVHLPGDAMGTPSMSLTKAAETLTTVTPAVVSVVPFERFGALFQDHPRLAAFLLLSIQRERVALMDWLSSVGRTPAESRLAALIVDLLDRLQPLGLVRNDSFRLRLTQEQMADALGLTPVHVNRMMRELEKQGLVSRDRQMLTVRNRTGLRRMAAIPVRELRKDLSWLPPSQ